MELRTMPAKPWSDLSDAERAVEEKSLRAGRKLEAVETPQGAADILIGAPIPGWETVPVMIVFSSDPTHMVRACVSTAEARKLLAAHKPAHPQVHIRHGEVEADVDEKIAPLILEVWRAGITTTSSCQEFSLRGTAGVWIVFPTKTDGKLFSRITKCPVAKSKIRQKDFEASGWDREPGDEERVGTYIYYVLFPPSEVEPVLARLRKHNDKLASS